MAQGAPIPPLTGYTATGLVNGESMAVLSGGAPTIITTATSQSPLGTYPIAISQGSLTSPNYVFTFVNGALSIINGQPQTVTFAPIANTV